MNDEKFEKSLARLEEIVSGLEQGETDLDDALKLFEEGISLVRRCDKQLKEAEQKLEQLDASTDVEGDDE